MVVRSRASIIDSRFPSKMEIGKEYSYTFMLQNVGSDANYLAMVVAPAQLPSDGVLKIYVSSLGKWLTVKPGVKGEAVSNRIVNPGEVFDFSGKMKVESGVGSWRVYFQACGFADGHREINQFIGVMFEVTEAPPPAPSWWWPWVALGLEVAGVLLIGGVIAYKR